MVMRISLFITIVIMFSCGNYEYREIREIKNEQGEVRIDTSDIINVNRIKYADSDSVACANAIVEFNKSKEAHKNLKEQIHNYHVIPLKFILSRKGVGIVDGCN